MHPTAVFRLKGTRMKKPLLIVAAIVLGTMTAAALWKEGPAGIVAAATHSYGAAQIFVDLVIALTLVMVWMWRDAKTTGRNV
jgi:hypothetical protein